jgi:hypothetical protein
MSIPFARKQRIKSNFNLGSSARCQTKDIMAVVNHNMVASLNTVVSLHTDNNTGLLNILNQ